MLVLKKPLLTEKSMQLAKNNLYTFLVDRKASKELVAKVIKKRFGVGVVSVKTMKLKPVLKRQRSFKGYFISPGSKKAIVQIEKGGKIDLFQPQEKEVEVKTAESEVATEKEEKKSLLKGTKVKIERGVKAAKSSKGMKAKKGTM